MPEPAPVQLVRRDVVYQTERFSVVRDCQRLPDGSEVSWESVTHCESVMVLPVDARGHVYFVEQYRPQLGRFTLEAVGGLREDGEPPESAARRELLEEAGIVARLIPLGSSELGVATLRMRQQLFLTIVERFEAAEREPFERHTVRGIRSLPIGEAVDLVKRGDVTDTTSRLLVMLAHENRREWVTAEA